MVWILPVFIFLLGRCIGSFLNVVILRLETSQSLSGRSHCPHCKHILGWKDLFPVFSYLFLRGKCAYCSQKISWQYPITEISTALIFLLILNFEFGISNSMEVFNIINLAFLFYITSSLIVILVYDLKHYIIPDKILFPAIFIAFVYRLFENSVIYSLNSNFKFQISNFAHLGNYFLAIIIASGFFLAIFLVSKGQWMGFGDVKLAILLGLILGFPEILLALTLAFFFGAIIGVSMMLLKKGGLKSKIPFAPFLISGTFVALLWGNQIISWYMNFLYI